MKRELEQKVGNMPLGISPSVPIYRKILKTGCTHYMAISHLIPDAWEIVDVVSTISADDIVLLRIRKIAPR